MAKTQKVMDIMFWGKHFVCIYEKDAKHNPYKLYEKYWDEGWHRKKLVEYYDMDSVLMHILQTQHKKLCWDLIEP